MQQPVLLFSILVAFSLVTIFQQVNAFELNNSINLLNLNETNWSNSANVQLNSVENKLDNFTVQTLDNNTSYNRINTSLHFEALKSLPFFYLNYATNSSIGNPMFVVEIRKYVDSNTYNLGSSTNEENYQRYLWSENMGNTLGYFTTRILPLPADINNSDIEIRFYIISKIPTDAYVKFGNSTIFNT